MRALSRAINIISTVFTIAVILCAGVFFVPRLFGYTPYVVLSGSMEPVIHTGAVAFVNTRDTEVRTGDIIAYRLDDTIVLHRVIGETPEGGYITMGDANEIADLNPVSQGQVAGTYTIQIPGAGYLLSMLEQHKIQIGRIQVSTGTLFIIGMVILLNAIDFLLSDSAGPDRKEGAADGH